MKKKDIIEGMVTHVSFPNKGTIELGDQSILVKGCIKGQQVRCQLTKVREHGSAARFVELLHPSPLEDQVPLCPHFGTCGGCFYQTVSYENQLKIKEDQVRELYGDFVSDQVWEGIKGSPDPWEYRNKMEFSFGDEIKDGPLALGMHKKNSFHDIVNVTSCRIVNNDFNVIVQKVLDFFAKTKCSFYKKMQHTGYVRHLVIRRAQCSGDLLVNIVTTTQEVLDLEPLVSCLCQSNLNGRIVGILHTFNDSLSDVVQADAMEILYGQDYFYEEILGLQFQISPFSFFQTNSSGAEVLYETARDFAGETKDKVIFDLYSGTGTIAQMLAPVAKKVVGVEIVEEAVEAAKENAKLNGLDNCEFIAGDVLKVVDELTDRPDLIILDPPRDGVHPKAIRKIIDFGVDEMVYISCKPTSLERDLGIFRDLGYNVIRAAAVDMFPQTPHVETVVLLSKGEIDSKKIQVEFSLKDMDMSGF